MQKRSEIFRERGINPALFSDQTDKISKIPVRFIEYGNISVLISLSMTNPCSLPNPLFLAGQKFFENFVFYFRVVYFNKSAYCAAGGEG